MLKPRKVAILAVAVAAGGVLCFLLFQFENRGASGRTAAPSQNTQGGAPPSGSGVDAKAHEIKVLEDGLRKKPGHVPVLFQMAQLKREVGKPAEAAQHLREILTQEPKNLEARLELGRALYEAGDVEGAIGETNRILELEPRHADALYNLGAIYGNLNRDELARQYWTRAVASDPQSESGRNAKRGLEQLAGTQVP